MVGALPEWREPLSGLGIDPGPIKAYASELAILKAKVTTTICPYCGVGCGLIVHTDQRTGRIINIEGDSDHPINEGSLCAKGAGLYQMDRQPQAHESGALPGALQRQMGG